ncbi:flippase [Vibrio europaeus]|uniref:flippase n=1 Tax=Vibrio europaeus TaxID=300876 RepID=UPI00234168E7|nr:flippase [Vibrio europaeus]MDC5852098.1 flippase [Vibrio europaeus]
MKALNDLKGKIQYPSFANTAWLLAEKFIQLFIGLGVAIYVARYLGPESYGILSYSQSMVLMFSAVAALGIDNVVVREITRNKDKAKEIVLTAITMKIVGGLVAIFLSVLSAYLLSEKELEYVLVLIISLSMLFTGSSVINLYFQSFEKLKYSSIANIFAFATSGAFKVVLIMQGADLIWFAVALMLDSVFLAIGLAFVYVQDIKDTVTRVTLNWPFAKRIFLESWPLIFSLLAVTVYSRIDQVMIMQMLDEHAVGLYSVSMKLYDAAIVIPSAIIVSLFPKVINAGKENSDRAFVKYFELPILTIFSIAIFVSFSSFWFIPFFFGQEYESSSEILNILIWGGVFSVVGMIRSRWVTLECLQRYTIIYVVVGMLVNIILNYYFIPKYGVIGAAWASFVAQAISGLFGVLLISNTRPFFRIACCILNPFKWNFYRD